MRSLLKNVSTLMDNMMGRRNRLENIALGSTPERQRVRLPDIDCLPKITQESFANAMEQFSDLSFYIGKQQRYSFLYNSNSKHPSSYYRIKERLVCSKDLGGGQIQLLISDTSKDFLEAYFMYQIYVSVRQAKMVDKTITQEELDDLLSVALSEFSGAYHIWSTRLYLIALKGPEMIGFLEDGKFKKENAINKEDFFDQLTPQEINTIAQLVAACNDRKYSVRRDRHSFIPAFESWMLQQKNKTKK